MSDTQLTLVKALAASAVSFVEQTGKELTSEEKKAAAESALMELAEEYGVPVPASLASVLIEEAVKLMNDAAAVVQAELQHVASFE